MVKYRTPECGRSQAAMMRALLLVMIHESYSSFDTWNRAQREAWQSIIQAFGIDRGNCKGSGGGDASQAAIGNKVRHGRRLKRETDRT